MSSFVNNLWEILWLAARNLVRNQRRSLLSAASIAIGVAAILCSKSYVDGLERLILEFVIDAREGALQVQRGGYGASREMATLDLNLPEAGPIPDRVSATPGVRAVAPRLRFIGLVSNGEMSTAFGALGLDPAREAQVCPRGPGAHLEGVLVGPGLTSDDEDKVVLGQGLARSLRATVGSQITLLVTSRGGALETADLTVAGTYPFPDAFEDKHFLVVPLKVAQRLVHLPGRVTSLAVALAPGALLEGVLARLRTDLAGSDPAVELHPWWELSPYFRDIITLEGDLMRAVIFIIFMMVVAGVVNTMLMSVLERTREIGTLMAMGFRRRRILFLFLAEAMMLTLIAAIIGVAIGACIVVLVGRTGIAFELPGAGVIRVFPKFNVLYVGWSVAAALAGGLVGGLLPARRASRMRPIEALRNT